MKPLLTTLGKLVRAITRLAQPESGELLSTRRKLALLRAYLSDHR
jgi:hypothetical protein